MSSVNRDSSTFSFLTWLCFTASFTFILGKSFPTLWKSKWESLVQFSLPKIMREVTTFFPHNLKKIYITILKVNNSKLANEDILKEYLDLLSNVYYILLTVTPFVFKIFSWITFQMHVHACVLSCLSLMLCDPMDCSLPSSSSSTIFWGLLRFKFMPIELVIPFMIRQLQLVRALCQDGASTIRSKTTSTVRGESMINPKPFLKASSDSETHHFEDGTLNVQVAGECTLPCVLTWVSGSSPNDLQRR